MKLCNMLRIPSPLLCIYPLPELFCEVPETLLNMSISWRKREHTPACLCIYFISLTVLSNLKFPFAWISWPETVSQFSGKKFLKAPKSRRGGSRGFLTSNLSTKHFWWVKYKQIRFIEAKFFLINMNLIMGLGLGGRKKRLGEWSWETCWVSLITNDCERVFFLSSLYKNLLIHEYS